MSAPTYAQAGGEHSLRLDPSTGTVFSAGACGLGYCRLAKLLSPVLFSWRRVSLPESAMLIHASYYHNLAVTASGSLYTWGCGTFVDGNDDGVIPALGGRKDDKGAPPVRVTLPDLVPGERVVGVSGGAYHSVCLTSTGRVLTFGAAQLGQLGRPLGPQASTDGAGLPVDSQPRDVAGLPQPEKDRAKSVGAGFYNTLVACASGTLFCSGENQNKQCGRGEGKDNLHRMTAVEELKQAGVHVVAASGGYCHTLVLTRDGRVLSMGCGDEGQRGDGRADDDDRPVVSEIVVPVRAGPSSGTTISPSSSSISSISSSKRAKCVAVASGANHSVVLTEQGRVFAFGSNEFGQCGVVDLAATEEEKDADEDDDDATSAVLLPTELVVPSAADAPGNGSGGDDDTAVVSISAGYAHTVIETAAGRVLTFGQNENGQLGLGDKGVPVASVAHPTTVATRRT